MMAIRGWTGETREMPVVRVQYFDDFDNAPSGWVDDFDGEKTALIEVIADCMIYDVHPHASTDCQCWDRTTGESYRYRIHPDDLAALKELAAAHGGTWRAEGG